MQKPIQGLEISIGNVLSSTFLQYPSDGQNCMELQVQAGAGGTESMDWASMVMRMYKMWAQNRDYEVTVVDEMPGEEAGIKVLCLTSTVFVINHYNKSALNPLTIDFEYLTFVDVELHAYEPICWCNHSS